MAHSITRDEPVSYPKLRRDCPGVYEFFARTIPGGFYLFTIVYVSVLTGLTTIDLQMLNNFSIVVVLVFVVFAYILGLVLDPFAVWWHRLFKPKGYSKVVLNEFKKKHIEWAIRVEDEDWPILRAYLRRENLEVVNQIDTHNTTSILLRNASLNLIVLAIIQVIQFLQFGYIWNLVLWITLSDVVKHRYEMDLNEVKKTDGPTNAERSAQQHI